MHFQVLAGTNRLLDYKDGELLNVENAIIHPQYNVPKNYNNDIALLRLNRDLPFSQKIRFIELGQDSQIVDGSQVAITGWGTTEVQ